MTRRVLVLGATGHLGKLFIDACRKRNLEVSGVSRRGGKGVEALDLNDSGVWKRFLEFDVVVNATDTTKVPPFEMASFCMNEGLVFIETSADPKVFQQFEKLEPGPGTVVAGAGAFPGLSTYLLDRASETTQRLDFRATWSVLSAAGRGTIEIMLDGLTEDALALRDGKLVTSAPLAECARFSVGGKERSGFLLGAPDVVLAKQRYPQLSESSFWAAVRPGFPKWVLKLMSKVLGLGLLKPRWMKSLARFYLMFLRKFLFGWASSSLRIELFCDNNLAASFETRDGFAAGAASLAVLAEKWPKEVTGLALPQAGVSWNTMKAEISDWAEMNAFDSKESAAANALGLERIGA